MVFAGCKLNTLYIRGIIVSNWFDSNIFRDMNTQTKLYVQPSEVNKFQTIYNGPVYPLPKNFDYLPFVELGKTWHVEGSPSYYEPYYHFLTCRMNEEVERDGKTYIQVKQSEDGRTGVSDVGLFREEDRRVYKYIETENKEVMLYDFSLKEGDTFTYEFEPDIPENFKVLKQGWLNDGPQIVSSITRLSADSVDITYRPLRTWTIGIETEPGIYHERTTWVEGVGSLVNTFCPSCMGGINSLAYIERKNNDGDLTNNYLPFSFYNMFGQVYGCELPIGAENNEEDDEHHKLTYELEGDRLHVYGEVFCNCGPNHYAYFCEKPTDDPSVHKIEFITQDVEPLMWCVGLHATDFYVSGFDPNLNYIVVDNQGVEHPVINKTPQMVYRPFVEEGKVWKVGDITSGNPAQCVEHFYFDGDTIVGGKACKKMMCQRYVTPDYSDYEVIMRYPLLRRGGVWYEEDKKVYEYNTTDKQFKLMYDFSVDDNATLQIHGQSYVVGPKLTEGLKGFKGVYRNVMWPSWDGEQIYDEGQLYNTTWLEGVGSIEGPGYNVYLGKEYHGGAFLMSCTVGDEVIYFNGEYEDGATPEITGSRKNRFDFSHTVKTKPKSRTTRGAEPSLYGEYNDQQLGINLNPLYDAYLVSITDETGKIVYEKNINAGTIVGLNIDISAYPEGRYTVTVENNNESFTGEFDAQTAGVGDALRLNDNEKIVNDNIFDLQGRQLQGKPQRGLYIRDGKKVMVK